MSPVKSANLKALAVIILVVCFIALYNVSSVNVALPAFMAHFGVSIGTVQWLMIGYSLTMGVISPMAGYFAKRFGLRRYFLVSLAGFVVLAFLSGVVSSIYMMIFIRMLQGFVGAALIPVSMILIFNYVPRARQPLFLTLQSMSLSLGPAIGPLLAGLLIQFVHWRWMFWVNVPVGLLAMVLVMRALPKEAGADAHAPDLPSLVSCTIGCFLILFSFSMAEYWGLLSTRVLGMLVVGSVLTAYFVRRQGHLHLPMLDFSVLRYRAFSITLLINCLLSMAICVGPFLFAIYLQSVRGYSPLGFGLLLLIPAIFSMSGAPIAQWLYARTTTRNITMLGLLCLVIGGMALSFIRVDSAMVFVMGALCVRYFGIGLLGMPLTDYGMKILPPALKNDGSTLLNWAKLMSNSLALSVFTLVYTLIEWDALTKMTSKAAAVAGVNAVFFWSGLLLVIGMILTARLRPIDESTLPKTDDAFEMSS